MTLPRYTAGGSLPTARQLNDITGELSRRGKLYAAPPLYLTDGPGGETLTFSDSEWWAVVCCQNPDDSYQLSEVVMAPGGVPLVMDGGRRCSGWNLCRDFVNPGTVTRVYPGFAGEFVFFAPEGSPRITDYCPSCEQVSSSSSSSSSRSSSSSSASSASSGVSSASAGSSSSSSSSRSSSSSSSSSSRASSPSSSSGPSSGVSSSASSAVGCSDTICVITGVDCVGGNLVVTKTCYRIVGGQFCEVPNSSSAAPPASSVVPPSSSVVPPLSSVAPISSTRPGPPLVE